MQLPLSHPQLGTWPTTQACAPTRNRTSDCLVRRPGSQASAQSTEPHQPGLKILFKRECALEAVCALLWAVTHDGKALMAVVGKPQCPEQRLLLCETLGVGELIACPPVTCPH